MHPVPAPLRRTRTVVISAIIVALAAAAHILAGGSLPGLALLIGLAALVTVPVAALTSRRLSLAAMTALLGTGQLVLHEVFMQMTPVHAGTMEAHSHGMASTDSPVMLGAHLLATVGTAVVLAKNEAALFALIGWLHPLVRLPRPQCHPSTPLVPPALVIPYLPTPWRRLKIRPLRGPPLLRTIEL